MSMVLEELSRLLREANEEDDERRRREANAVFDACWDVVESLFFRDGHSSPYFPACYSVYSVEADEAEQAGDGVLWDVWFDASSLPGLEAYDFVVNFQQVLPGHFHGPTGVFTWNAKYPPTIQGRVVIGCRFVRFDEEEYRATFAHEFTHWQDQVRTGGRNINHGWQGSNAVVQGRFKQYRSTPVEWNAFYQGNTTLYLRMLAQLTEDEANEFLPWFYDFKHFLQSYKAQTFFDPDAELKPDMARRYKKRLLNLWQSIKADPAKYIPAIQAQNVAV